MSKEWPPTKEDIHNIALAAIGSMLRKKNIRDVIVLVYWDNLEVMIFDPVHFAATEYSISECSIRNPEDKIMYKIIVKIGKED